MSRIRASPGDIKLITKDLSRVNKTISFGALALITLFSNAAFLDQNETNLIYPIVQGTRVWNS
ncbi:hypothetical protein MJO29_006859 [Puccinia striiformis f. sp. tritici]|nr:hypothetical protein MJO29_006859 [Puccinia striiformis f. sp. tritici]